MRPTLSLKTYEHSLISLSPPKPHIAARPINLTLNTNVGALIIGIGFAGYIIYSDNEGPPK